MFRREETILKAHMKAHACKHVRCLRLCLHNCLHNCLHKRLHAHFHSFPHTCLCTCLRICTTAAFCIYSRHRHSTCTHGIGILHVLTASALYIYARNRRCAAPCACVTCRSTSMGSPDHVRRCPATHSDACFDMCSVSVFQTCV